MVTDKSSGNPSTCQRSQNIRAQQARSHRGICVIENSALTDSISKVPDRSALPKQRVQRFLAQHVRDEFKIPRRLGVDQHRTLDGRIVYAK